MGDPLDPATRVGALVDAEHCAKVSGYLGGDAIAGGTVDGNFVSPTIYEVGKDDPRAREEIFGPVLSIIEVASTEEAIAVANDTDYGLAASVFTANARTALRAARDIKAGTVTVNAMAKAISPPRLAGSSNRALAGATMGLRHMTNTLN